MNRIVIEIDTEATFFLTGQVPVIKRFVLRSDKIKGLAEFFDGTVQLAIQVNETADIINVVPKNSFDEIAEFMTK